MRITAIDSMICNAQMRNWVFIRVETDTPGLVGWGEATLEWKTRAVVGAIEDLAPLTGEDNGGTVFHAPGVALRCQPSRFARLIPSDL